MLYLLLCVRGDVMKYEEIQFNKDRLEKIGDEGSEFLSKIEEGEDYLTNRQIYYRRLMSSVAFIYVGFFFLSLSTVINLTRTNGEPYVTTQDGQIIKIEKYEVRKR